MADNLQEKHGRPTGNSATTLQFCRQISREIIKIYIAELLKKGVSESVLNSALSNVWGSIEKINEKINRECGGEIADKLKDKVKTEVIEAKINEQRKDHFGRLLVHQISHLFPEYDDTETAKKIAVGYVDNKVPRQIIPGFIDAVKAMFGDEYIETTQKKLEGIVRKFPVENGLVNWDRFFGNNVVLEILRGILTQAKKTIDDMNENEEIDDTKALPTWFVNRMTQTDEFTKDMERDLSRKEYELIYEALFRVLK
ncbi:MAG: hypothetical protein OEY64_05175 [Nitrospinota bacterium]|nr:hypothetical protein [Nitrospinota bacterium]